MPVLDPPAPPTMAAALPPTLPVDVDGATLDEPAVLAPPTPRTPLTPPPAPGADGPRRIPTRVVLVLVVVTLVGLWILATRRSDDQPTLVAPTPTGDEVTGVVTVPGTRDPSVTPIVTVPPRDLGSAVTTVTTAPVAPAVTAPPASAPPTTVPPTTIASVTGGIELTVQPIGSGNDEWVEITNNGAGPIDLTGWSVFHDGLINLYRFRDGELVPGTSLRLFSGCGEDDATSRYWCSSTPDIWNDEGDLVTLVDDDQAIVATVSG